ncbi:DNA-directed RNA polymerase [Pleosporales sp. CAS-2024a]
MLAHAAQRRLRSEALVAHARACEQLTRPWLCPAPVRRRAHTAAATPARRSTGPRQERRSLATTAELQPASSQAPFDGLAQAWGSRLPPPELAQPLSTWDSSGPLMLREKLAIPSITSKRAPLYVGSTPTDLHQNLYACLQVGRMNRAAFVLARLNELLGASAPELVDAHDIYLQTLFQRAQQDPKPDSMSSLEEWYADNFEANGVKPTAATFVTLLRAAMNFLEGDAQDAALRKYMAMAHESGEDMIDQVNCSPEFTEQEWDTLIRAQPDEFEEPPRPDQVQEMLGSSLHARMYIANQSVTAKAASDVASKAHIEPVAQKGLGLRTLKAALGVFDENAASLYPADMQGTQEEKEMAHDYARQVRLEQDGLDAAVERWRQEDEKLQAMGIFGVMKNKSVQALMHNWTVALAALLKKHCERTKQIMATPEFQRGKDPALAYGPWLERCSPDKLAAITVSRVVSASIQRDRGSASTSSKLSALSLALGTDIMDFVNRDAHKRQYSLLRKQRQQLRTDLVGKLHKTQVKQNTPALVDSSTPFDNEFQRVQIPAQIRTQMGVVCLELLIQSATITVTANDPKTGELLSSTQPAFLHTTEFVMGKRVGFIALNPQLTQKLRNEPVHDISPLSLPMLVEPKPWTSFQDGGYYTIPGQVLRQKSADGIQREYATAAIRNGDLKQVLAGLDVLGRIPWQINAPVFKIMAEAWNRGEGLAGLIPREPDLIRPEEPPSDAPAAVRAQWAKLVQEYENTKGGLHSQRCFQNFQLEVARAFVDEKKIFFPHSVDFRGRAYPIPPILNHIGADVARGLLKFARAKELGTVGLQWLKIHLANLYGYDKASLKEREQFAMDHMDDIYDSATNPLGGQRWWAQAEDPWQCLACCMELKNAFESPDPTRYMSTLPVHQDGTCNGLQHYAALGGDQAGARQVNLEPSDRPQDIYTGVAEMVKAMVEKDVAKGHNIAQFIHGRISRKVVKRTVMTNVYGVTFVGARNQVQAELRDMFPNFRGTDKVGSLASVAMYIALRIFEALGQIFNGAQEIQYWLGECGDRITQSLSAEQFKKIGERAAGLPMQYDPVYKTPQKWTKTELAKFDKAMTTFRTGIIWTTPLKMPVVQPYRKDSTTTLRTGLQELTIVKTCFQDPVDKRKQLQAFPPNFIHSLDATHMTLSALKCAEHGLDFAAVHDSFWTHASDIPNLNVILRDAFVRMHSDDIVGRLFQEFQARYAGAMHMANIKASSAAGAEIRKWRIRYYKSLGSSATQSVRHKPPVEELVLEYQRQKLLQSKDEKKVKQGQEMQTPTSIWLQHQDPKALASFRLNLLGEVKTVKGKGKTSAYDEVRDKILDREAEVVVNEGETAHAVDGASEVAEAELEAEAEAEASMMKQYHSTTVPVWVPLTFPPPPKKGDWDISRLRESEYFFS